MNALTKQVNGVFLLLKPRCRMKTYNAYHPIRTTDNKSSLVYSIMTACTQEQARPFRFVITNAPVAPLFTQTRKSRASVLSG